MPSFSVFALLISTLSVLVLAENQNCGQYQAKFREIELDPLIKSKKTWTAEDSPNPANANFTYYISICNPVQPSLYSNKCSQQVTDPNTVAVIQVVDHTKECYVIGRTSSVRATNFSVGWVMMTFGKGDIYRSHCNGDPRKAEIFFLCDHSAGLGKPTILEENRDDFECAYTFEWKTNLVCASSGGGLGVGSIFVITFFCLVIAYLLFGFLYQRIVNEAKGREQIPNFPFWKKLGNLIADGCDYVCRCSEKAQSPPYKPEERHSQLQLDDSDEDDEKDDTLLPM
eukprot:m.309407 g.309407  ORF g.309407 m.309407 type:complete len:284 (+) comp46358_c0_seq1:52-903(+)